MSLQTIYYTLKTQDTSSLPPFIFSYMTYLPATETETFIVTFIIWGADKKTYEWKLSNGEWVGGIEEEGYSVGNELSLELKNILKITNFDH